MLFLIRNRIHPIDRHHQEVTTYLLMHIPSWNKSMLRGKLGVYHPYCSTKFSTGECRSNYVQTTNVVCTYYNIFIRGISVRPNRTKNTKILVFRYFRFGIILKYRPKQLMELNPCKLHSGPENQKKSRAQSIS